MAKSDTGPGLSKIGVVVDRSDCSSANYAFQPYWGEFPDDPEVARRYDALLSRQERRFQGTTVLGCIDCVDEVEDTLFRGLLWRL
mmetsp:Transcript_13446/g.37146  ORF Transcript_13446/g.37146 Transcript_13446/m.37146 type:complete len:85 (+) Transcript_13446:365-619(+)